MVVVVGGLQEQQVHAAVRMLDAAVRVMLQARAEFPFVGEHIADAHVVGEFEGGRQLAVRITIHAGEQRGADAGVRVEAELVVGFPAEHRRDADDGQVLLLARHVHPLVGAPVRDVRVPVAVQVVAAGRQPALVPVFLDRETDDLHVLAAAGLDRRRIEHTVGGVTRRRGRQRGHGRQGTHHFFHREHCLCCESEAVQAK